MQNTLETKYLIYDHQQGEFIADFNEYQKTIKYADIGMGAREFSTEDEAASYAKTIKQIQNGYCALEVKRIWT